MLCHQIARLSFTQLLYNRPFLSQGHPLEGSIAYVKSDRVVSQVHLQQKQMIGML